MKCFSGKKYTQLFIGLISCCIAVPVVTVNWSHAAESERSATLTAEDLLPFGRVVTGQAARFRLTVRATVPIDHRPQTINLEITRFGPHSYDFLIAHEDYALELRRREDATTLVLPRHETAFVGSGSVSEADSLDGMNVVRRLISADSRAVVALPFFEPGVLASAVPLLDSLLSNMRETSRPSLTCVAPGELSITSGEIHIQVVVSEDVGAAGRTNPKSYSETSLPRSELEGTLLRGVRRATEILWPASSLTSPPQRPKSVPHGELKWIDGHRVAILSGTPQDIGTAHAQLLEQESRRCIESVLYTFGTVHVVRTGHWFRHDLEAAYARLSPHIPQRHKQEVQALAESLGMPPETLNVLNVFPEMFHCSGFALFGTATKDGRLYHGRVLDYMTTIGLQDAATTFIVQPEGCHGFANVGYAAFVGSVSGMNDQAISLGEMGGRGEGNWDGVPMATLMRRALEECSTLDEVTRLWANSPRTCEYYYVFADGKTNQAVGVAALPESIEFIQPGQFHERLGDGIADAVVLSAGSRLETLRARVIEKHGQIDSEVSKWLMSRPVAMQSNLHNVLFVPELGILHVANASHSKPAAEQPYVELNLNQLLSEAHNKEKRAGLLSQP